MTAATIHAAGHGAEAREARQFAERKAEAAQRGKLRGIGYSTFVEACGLAPSAAAGSLGAGVGLWESAEVRVNPVGTVEILTGCHSHGQGHETTFAQLVADRFGLPIDNVSIVHGDTDKVQFGMGTYGSRSGPVGMSAMMKALDKVEEKAKKIAAHVLEASEDDIVIEGGEAKVAGTDKKMGWHEVGLAAYTAHNLPEGMEPGLKETSFFDPAELLLPVRRADLRGGGRPRHRRDRDRAVHRGRRLRHHHQPDDRGGSGPWRCDAGHRSGDARGVVYDEDGQLITGSYMDYQMPRAADVPAFTLDHGCTPSPLNPLGVKGCGEAGAIGAPPAVINAITDAIGTNDLQMPATPLAVWTALQKVQAPMAAE
jgi:carbon-monoxide dehydrogenase large subunit